MRPEEKTILLLGWAQRKQICNARDQVLKDLKDHQGQVARQPKNLPYLSYDMEVALVELNGRNTANNRRQIQRCQ